MPLIYHITSASLWNAAREQGKDFEAPSLKTEGFIHCSMENQVDGVLERYYQGQTDLVKLVIEPEKLNSKLVHEWSPSTRDTFPHIYGPINLDAVIEVVAL